MFPTNLCHGNGGNYRDDPWRYPATKTDGKYLGPGAIREGTRIQLDPALTAAGRRR